MSASGVFNLKSAGEVYVVVENGDVHCDRELSKEALEELGTLLDSLKLSHSLHRFYVVKQPTDSQNG